MRLIFLKTLKAHRFGILLIMFIIAGLGILVTTSYQAFGEETLGLFSQQTPSGLSALFKAEDNMIMSAGFQGYVAIGFRHPLFLILGSAFAIATAGRALAGEIERKTILILLARPISRFNLVVIKEAESMIGLFMIAISMLIGVVVGTTIGGLWGSSNFEALWCITVNVWCLFSAVCGYSYFISALSDDGGRAILLSTGLTVAFFFIDFVSGLFDILEPIGFASIFHYYDPLSLMGDTVFPILHVGILSMIAATTLFSAATIFRHRDITA